MTAIDPAAITLKVDSTDLASLDGFSWLNMDGFVFERAPFRGANVPVPTVDGETSYAKPRDAFNFDCSFRLMSATPDAAGAWGPFMAAVNAMYALIAGNLHTLTRHIPQTASPGYVDEVCAAERITVTVSRIPGMAAEEAGFWYPGRDFTITWRNLDGIWA